MESLSASRAVSKPRSDKLRRIAATLDRIGDDAVRTANERAGGWPFGCQPAARELLNFGFENYGAANWLRGLAGGAAGERELDRIAARARMAGAVAGRVSVNVEVRRRPGSRVTDAEVDAVRELCQTAPATVGHLLQRLNDGGRELAGELRELERRGLIQLERGDDGEIRCRPAEGGEA